MIECVDASRVCEHRVWIERADLVLGGRESDAARTEYERVVEPAQELSHVLTVRGVCEERRDGLVGERGAHVDLTVEHRVTLRILRAREPHRGEAAPCVVETPHATRVFGVILDVGEHDPVPQERGAVLLAGRDAAGHEGVDEDVEDPRITLAREPSALRALRRRRARDRSATGPAMRIHGSTLSSSAGLAGLVRVGKLVGMTLFFRAFSTISLVSLVSLVACERAPDVDPALVVTEGVAHTRYTPRPEFGTLALRVTADRVYRLQSVRLADGDHRRRFVVASLGDTSEDVTPLWAYPAEGAETNAFIDDFTLHPSGDVTLTLEHRGQVRDTYELLRFTREGELRYRAALPAGARVPDTDLGDLPRPPFRMKSSWNDDALAEGWVRVVAEGEDVVVAFQTTINRPNDEFTFEHVSAVSWIHWDGETYTETRTRLVDGRHGVGPAAWAYDEFRWRQVAVRPYLAVDSETGHVVVGRTWSNPRCMAALEIFGEGSQVDCVFDSVSPIENERLPFAFTSFAPDGSREGTHVWMPESTSEFVTFDMAVSNGVVALAGSHVREDAEGVVTYYDGNLVPYDGYVALLDRATGALVFERDIDASGRGDALHTIRFVEGGLIAAGAADWDRWNGGMSISRGADPWFVHITNDGVVSQRRVEVDAPSRHTHLLAVDVRLGAHATIFGAGLFDAPMTHSGDGGQTAEMVFGDAFVSLRAP